MDGIIHIRRSLIRRPLPSWTCKDKKRKTGVRRKVVVGWTWFVVSPPPLSALSRWLLLSPARSSSYYLPYSILCWTSAWRSHLPEIGGCSTTFSFLVETTLDLHRSFLSANLGSRKLNAFVLLVLCSEVGLILLVVCLSVLP